MSIVALGSNSLIALFLSSLALGVGASLLQRLRFAHTYSVTLGLSYLLGLGVLGNIGLLLGLIGQFKVTVVYGIFAVLFLCFSKIIYRECRLLVKAMWEFVRQMLNTSKIASAVILLMGIIVVLNYLAAFIPPLAPDEVAYHYPEAQLLATSHRLEFPHGGHYFYGNLPLSMEILSALGLLLERYAVGHILQFVMFLALVFFCFGWLRQRYTLTTAIAGAAILFGLHDILYYSTTGYVDTADVVVQAIGILLLIDWLHRREASLLMVSGLLFGFALAIKYTAVFSIGMMGLFLTGAYLLTLPTQKRLQGYGKIVASFVVPMLVFGGFWYIKNAWLYGNPMYPLYFGHSDVDEASYQSLIAALQLFSFPRTITNYLLVPLRYYWAYTKQLDTQSVLVLLGLLATPFAFIRQRYRRDHLLLLSYCIIYSVYWFFFATHQTRFLHLPIIILTLLGVIVVTTMTSLWRKVFVGLVLATAIGLNIYYPKLDLTYARKAIVTIDPKPAPDEHWVYAPLRVDALLFTLGKLQPSDY